MAAAIVNVASGAALRPVPFRNGYSASKAGVLAMTRHHACAFARDGIRVNAVAPGYTRTELVDELIARGRIDPAAVARRIPLGRMAAPEEIAAVIAFLASRRGLVSRAPRFSSTVDRWSSGGTGSRASKQGVGAGRAADLPRRRGVQFGSAKRWRGCSPPAMPR